MGQVGLSQDLEVSLTVPPCSWAWQRCGRGWPRSALMTRRRADGRLRSLARAPSLESPIVDELQPLVCVAAASSRHRLRAATLPLNSSHRFTWCPVLMCPRCALSRLVRAHSSGPAFWMQTTGAALLAISRRSPVHVWTPVQDSRGAHGLLYLAAVRYGRNHLIRRDLLPPRLPGHFATDLLRCLSLMRSRRRC
jgi:hypothetical protein